MANDMPLSARIQTNLLTRYGIAFVAVAVALLIARSLNPLLGMSSFYVAVFPAVAFSAWYCGLGPSAVVAILGLLGLKYWFLTPLHLLAIPTPGQALSMMAFFAGAVLIGAMGEVRRRENRLLCRGHGELEERVTERTSELDAANQELRELTARLMQSQDDERRRIARELHDSVGQTLAALTMNLTSVVAGIEQLVQTGKSAAESLALVEDMNKEVRTVSYLLHPPLLDEAGLASALRWYVEGFSQRSKIQIDLDIAEDFGRLQQDLEISVFRTVQECLTNIHRHSGSATAKIHVIRSDNEIRLKVEDNGVGMPVDKLREITSPGAMGVGLRGMRERVQQLGGNLDIRSDGKGTAVEATLPITNLTAVAA